MNFAMTKWEGRGRISSIKIDQAADGVELWEICKTALIDCIKNSLKCNKTNRFLVLGWDGVTDPANATSILGCWRINGVCLGNILVFLMENTSKIKGLLYIRGLVGRVKLSNSQRVFWSLYERRLCPHTFCIQRHFRSFAFRSSGCDSGSSLQNLGLMVWFAW